MILEHPIHIQVFKYNHRWTLCVGLGFGHNATGRFVEGIPPNVSDPKVQFGNLLAGLLAVRAAFLLTRVFALQPPELLVRFLQGFGVFVTGTVRACRQGWDAQVNPNRHALGWYRVRDFFFHLCTDKPASGFF